MQTLDETVAGWHTDRASLSQKMQPFELRLQSGCKVCLESLVAECGGLSASQQAADCRTAQIH